MLKPLKTHCKSSKTSDPANFSRVHISYEIIKKVGAICDTPLGKMISYPGMLLQRFWAGLGCFWIHFGRNVDLLWEVFFNTFSDLAKNAAPHESTENSSRNEGLAPGKAIKKHLNE